MTQRIRSVNTEREADNLLGEGWELFAVVANPHTKQTDVQEGGGIKPYDYILVRRLRSDPTVR
jgi:hypothetical protein